MLKPIVFAKPPQTCGSCRFFMGAKGRQDGVCRRIPATPLFMGFSQPQMMGLEPQPMVAAFFPPMGTDGWCGEYDYGADVSRVDLSKLIDVEDAAE